MWVFKFLRALAFFFSLYVLYRGLQLGSMRMALPYLLPGVFWGAYYYHFVREILSEGELSLGDKVWYVLFMVSGIAGIFTGTALSRTRMQFFSSFAIWILTLVVLIKSEEMTKSIICKLRAYSDTLLPGIFFLAGAFLCFMFPAPLNFTYLLTFVAIGGTIYEWELEERNTRQ